MIATALIPIDGVKRTEFPFSRHQATAFDFLTNTVLPMLNPNGAWIAPGPSPLSMTETIEVFVRVIEHPAYENQRLSTPAAHGERLTYDPATRMIEVDLPGGPA